MKTLRYIKYLYKIIKILLMITIRLVIPILVNALYYIIFFFVMLFIRKYSKSHFIDMIFTNIDYIFKNLSGKLLIIIFLVFAVLYIFLKENVYIKQIISDIKKILWDIVFSILYIWKSIFQFIKNKDINEFENNITLYFKTWTLTWINYFTLNKIEKKLFKKWNKFEISLYYNINSYFNKEYNCSIVDFEAKWKTYNITLYRPKSLKWNEILRQDRNDFIHALWYDINKYETEISVSNTITITITEKENNKIINIKDYIEKFFSDAYNIWLDWKWNIINFPINYSHSNHLWVYWMTWQWKSVFTSWLLYSLYNKNSNYRFYMIDPKWDFYWAKWVKNIEYAKDIKDIINLVSRIRMNLEKIKNEFSDKQVRNIEEYLKLNNDNKLSFIMPTFIFIEEFSYLLDSVSDIWKEEKENFLSNIKNIVQVWRSFWNTLILSLQKPISESIWSTIVKDMIRAISFKTSSTWEIVTFWERTWIDLDKLNIWEAVFQDNWKYKKFKSFYIDKNTLDEFNKENSTIEIKSWKNNILSSYLSYAKSINSFKLEEASKYWISRTQFDLLSKNLQEKWILIKTNNNHLIFNKNLDSKNNN